jgi:putative transposase
VEAADLHQARQHLQRADGDPGGWAGVDRGLTTFAVAAASDGREIARVDDPPKPLAAGLARQRRLARDVTRKQKGSTNHRKAAARLPRHHHRVRNIRQHFLHQVTNRLVKTHDRYAIEDLNVAGMLANHRLARAISDASWAEFARVLEYKLAWRGGQLARVDRWFPSSKTCSACGVVSQTLTLADRVFTCTACGHTLDRDLNAAVNLATWAETHAQVRDPEARGPVTNACRQDGSGPLTWADETCLNDAGTHSQTADAA